MVKKIQGNRGGVTIFLTLIFLITLSIIFVFLEIVRYEQAKGRVHHLVVGAVENLMADYQVELADWYHIYALDVNYLGQGKEVMGNRIWDYFEQNLMDYTLFGKAKGFYQFSVLDAGVQPERYLYSSGCHALKQQIRNWILDTQWIGEKRIKRTKSVKKTKYIQNSLQNKKSNLKTKNGTSTEENKVSVEEILETIDPRNAIERIKNEGILSVVSNQYIPLSKEIKSFQSQPSKTLVWEKENNNLLEQAKQKVELENYIFSHFQSALSVVREEETLYENEIEYLLTGETSDYDCLGKVVQELFLLRLPINLVAIKKDPAKGQQALVTAGIISAITMQPEAVDGIKNGILVAWASGESIGDIKCLLEGEKVPLIKNQQNWKVSFAQLFYLKGASLKESKEGIDYEDYLKILLAKEKEKTIYFRMLDLIQGNIDLKYPEFKIEDCMTDYTVTAKISIDRKFFQLPIQAGKGYQFFVQKFGSYQYE